MNQQRSRRFRAAKETKEKVEQIILIKNKLESLGVQLPREKDKSFHFDSNCITPVSIFFFLKINGFLVCFYLFIFIYESFQVFQRKRSVTQTMHVKCQLSVTTMYQILSS